MNFLLMRNGYMMLNDVISVLIQGGPVIRQVDTSEIIGHPVIRQNDTSAIIGQSVYFDCDVEYDHVHVMDWDFEGKRLYYYFEGQTDYPLGKTKYLVKQSGPSFKLEIKDLTLEDGGRYQCSTITTTDYVNLLVLGKFNFMNVMTM